VKFKLDFGTEIDLLTKGELDQSLGHLSDQWRAREVGVDYVTRYNTGIAAAVFTVPGPEQGWAWSMEQLSAQLSAAGTISVFWDAQQTYLAAPVSNNGTNVYVSWGSHQCVLKPGRTLTVVPSTGTITSLMFSAIQAPAERLALIL
jgi:hypothetical protein